MTNPNKKIAWINGQWDLASELDIPMNDRGVNFADGIFETILILKGEPQLLDNHLHRWEQSASILGMERPPGKEWLLELIHDGILYGKLLGETASLRLNWSRGDSITRGIDITNSKHRFWLEITKYKPSFQSISTRVSQSEKRNPYSLLSQCKTFSYGQQIQARREAQLSGYDDALLLNTSNEMCCGTTANLIIKRNKEFITPYLKSGCLPGIMRSQGIKKGLLKEDIIHQDPLQGDQWLLVNSLSCHSIRKLGQIELDVFTHPENLWELLLSK